MSTSSRACCATRVPPRPRSTTRSSGRSSRPRAGSTTSAPGAEKGFLFRIALNLAAHARRTMARRREVLADEAPERVESLATPEPLTDRKRMRKLLDRVLDKMDETLRVVFVLYEFEEMNMSEIADVLEIPRGTVASRLRRARAEFRERVGALEGVMNREGKA